MSPLTRAPPVSPPPEISTDLAEVAMVMVVMAVRTTCRGASEAAQASERDLGYVGEEALEAPPPPMESLKCDRI